MSDRGESATGAAAPHSLEAERSVLGTMLLHASAVPEVQPILRAQDFFLVRHQLIYRALLACSADQGATDPILVTEELRRHGRLDEAGGHVQLLDLVDSVVTAAGVSYHAEIIRDHARRRRLVEIARDVQVRAAHGVDLADLVSALTDQVGELEATAPRAAALTPIDVIGQWVKDGPLIHVPTGFRRLDEMTGGGLPYGSRCYLLGAPDAGKTAVAVQIADSFLERGIACGFLAIDEEPGDILGRFLQRRGFSRRDCERRDQLVIDAMTQQIAGLPLRLYGDTSSIEGAANDLATFARKQGRRAAFFVDSVQTARSDHEGAESSLYVAVTARVRAIRAATTAYGFVTYATSEMGRAAYRSVDAGERISDLAAAKESGAIEYSARFMVSLRSVSDENDLIEARVAKNKFGPQHRDGEPGVHLRIDRARQVLTEDDAYEAETLSNRDALRAAEANLRAVRDAATLAVLVADEPGIGKRDAESELRKQARCGTRRSEAAFSTLRHAIVEVKGPRNRLSLYLTGTKVPEDVLAEIPIDSRPGVTNSSPPSTESNELHRAAPTCTAGTSAPQSSCTTPPLRSRAGAARGCTSPRKVAAPSGSGAAQRGFP